MRRPAWISAVTVALVLVAGCSSKKSASSTTTSPTTAASGPSTTSGPASTSTTVASFSGSAGSSYCKLARQYSGIIAPNLAGKDAKQLFSDFDSESGPFVAGAPSDIKADVETVVGTIKQLEAEFQAVGYDQSKLTATDLGPLEAPTFTAATNRISAYDIQVCGMAPPTT